MEIIFIIIIIVGILSFLFSQRVNKNATKGSLKKVSVIYLNGHLNYQNGVEVKIKANTEQIMIDDKYPIPINSIVEVNIAKTKQLVEKQKNIIGRVAVGSLLAGPIGGIIGGVSGIGNNKETEEMEILNITFNDINKTKQTISFAWMEIEEKSVVLNNWINGLSERIKSKNRFQI